MARPELLTRNFHGSPQRNHAVWRRHIDLSIASSYHFLLTKATLRSKQLGDKWEKTIRMISSGMESMEGTEGNIVEFETEVDATRAWDASVFATSAIL